jgi:RimJ/RimL family protein N-acetyltransferase
LISEARVAKTCTNLCVPFMNQDERWEMQSNRGGSNLRADNACATTGDSLHRSMRTEDVVLQGKHVRLEPLGLCHIDKLVAAAGADPSLYQWSPVPQGKLETTRYVETALAWKDAGTAVPFAMVHTGDNVVIGSTRFWNLERWEWPQGHLWHGRSFPDVCEIGHPWLTRSAIRTAANTEAKLLMLMPAFEAWQVLRVCSTRTSGTRLRALRSNALADNSKGFCEHTGWPPTTPFVIRFVIRSWRRSGQL